MQQTERKRIDEEFDAIEDGCIEFIVNNGYVDAGFEKYPKALFIPKNTTRIANSIGVITKAAFGRGAWALVKDELEEADLRARISLR